MFAQGDVVGVAVSGGPDSVCLLDVLLKLRDEFGIALRVLHVNHRLRPESDGEEQFVRELAAARGLEFLSDHPVLEEGNLEEAARNARLRFFHRAPCDKVATGHTLSDQAETVLFRLLRGTGVRGLSGIRPVCGRLVRPLLAVSRTAVAAWVAEQRLAFREDSSNGSRQFARNRIRLDLLPQLEHDWNPRLTETLAHMAAIAADEEALLESLTPAVAGTSGQPVIVRAAELASLPPALERRYLRRIIAAVKGDLRRIDSAHIEAVRTMAPGHSRVILPGVDVLRSFEWVRFGTEVSDKQWRNWSIPLEKPGEHTVPGTGFVSVNWPSEQDAYNEGGPLYLRNWRPGDALLREEGHPPERLKLLFQEFRIPLWQRRHWPVVAHGEEVVWAGRFGFSARWRNRMINVIWRPDESEFPNATSDN